MSLPEVEDTLPELVRDVAALLVSVPVSIYHGKERFSRQVVTANRIEITQVGPERFGPPMGTVHGAEPNVCTREIAVQVLIEAKSERAGATERDHQAVANYLADLVFAAFLARVEERSQQIVDESATGGFVESPADELQVGARYVLAFQVSRGVKRLAQLLEVDGAELGLVPTGTINVTAGSQTETACGG